jgi:carbon storage regulator
MSGAAALLFAGRSPSIMEEMDSPAENTGRTRESVLGSLKETHEMLVLSRHKGESVVIGDDILITVVDIRDNKVRLGIECPATLSVHRREVYEAIQRQMRSAQPSPDPMDQLCG